ncbi:predicted protein [Thalassiosira pseudonana CCMP1335]|uniref:Uncharacterized protein n=1 Tax=Thalassiosira pseudonana TaxID=35128 RepID=B8CB81_THAPS|nr:predicted protein [Thalassiosira pseudonana CCMP1335]EED89272.1 predicted protein [Thalassiosira pseudonana CCMP1335]|eukprot:scaffold542_cov202-Alexandrium_tamarense.AAC.6
MFLPKNEAANADIRAAEQARRDGYTRIEAWATEAIPAEIRRGVTITVQEVQCGDPECAPIDTAVAIMFPSGGRGMLGLPLEAKDVSKEALLESFPTAQVLLAWSRGEEAEWPPMDDDDEQDFSQRPPLRFDVGQRVVCRVGPDPVTGWAPGRVIMLWYREPTWPANSWAPYKIELDDGRNIFAPGDVDQIIREHNG